MHYLIIRSTFFFAAALLTATLPAAAQPKTVNVKNFGAKADGKTDDTAALNAALAAGEKLGPGTVVFLPKGRYKMATGAAKSLVVANADHLTVQGEAGTVLVSGDLDSPVFRVNNSKNVTVRRVTIDRDPLGYTQGTIDRVDVKNNTCDVTMDANYPAPDAPLVKQAWASIHPFVFPTQGYYQLDRYWPKATQMTKTGERTWHWTLDGPPNIDTWPGKRFFIKTGVRGHAFDIHNLQDGTFEDVTYWGGGGEAGFYISGIEGTTTFRRFVIGVPPGSGRLYSCGGGGQISNVRGKLIFDGCDFSRIDDDGIDILSTWTRIVAQKDKRTLVVQHRDDFYRPGDRVEVWDWVHKKMRSAALVTAAACNADRSFTLTLDRDVATERVGAGQGEAFGMTAMSDGIDRLINTSTIGQETVIRNCKFQVFRAKCLNLKAPNCTVENCTFSASFQSAVSACPEWYFEEGPTIRNLTVRNCTFTGCNHFNIDIGAASYTGVPGADTTKRETPENTSHDSTNILIENNTFTGYGTTPSVFEWTSPVGPAMRLTNAAQVVLRGNRFGPLPAPAPSGTPKVRVEHSADVQFVRNTGLPQ